MVWHVNQAHSRHRIFGLQWLLVTVRFMHQHDTTGPAQDTLCPLLTGPTARKEVITTLLCAAGPGIVKAQAEDYVAAVFVP